MAKRKRVRNEPRINPNIAKEYGFSDKKLATTDKYVSPNEAAKILNVTGECIKQWIYHRRLPAVKLSNGYWKISISDLERFILAKGKPDNRRILLFDRPGPSQQATAAMLQNEGFEIIVANNPMDALLKAVDLVPGLFLINVSLDGGWELIKKVRESRHVRRLPLLVITDSTFDGDTLNSAMELEIQGVLQSPYNADDILREVKSVLGRGG
jgi:excisionase family DNA binding protein